MRTALNVAGVLLLLMGIVWILQGINVLPGSFMTGQTKWAVYGAISAVLGIALIFWASRRLM
jgi:uncharacterized membrane protein HdeD (DUF308 family)